MAKYPTRGRRWCRCCTWCSPRWVGCPGRACGRWPSILGLTTAEVEAVATFYTMLKLHPCGRYVLSVCTNPSCALLGGRRLFERAARAAGRRRRARHRRRPVHAGGGGVPGGVRPGARRGRSTTCSTTGSPRTALERDRSPASRAGAVPEASRGGVPGELRRGLADPGRRSGRRRRARPGVPEFEPVLTARWGDPGGRRRSTATCGPAATQALRKALAMAPDRRHRRRSRRRACGAAAAPGSRRARSGRSSRRTPASPSTWW